MVCGSFIVAVPPPGAWAPVQQQIPCMGDSIWQPLPPGTFDRPWTATPTKSTPCQMGTETTMIQNSEVAINASKRSKVSPPASSSGEPKRIQSAARAAKRQRGRERRKFYKALAHASAYQVLDTQASSETTECQESSQECLLENPTIHFEARAAAVAAEVKLVVKGTFLEVELSDDASSDDNDISLPEAFFKTNAQIDGWRRDYRRFRLGHHQGAQGEVTSHSLMVA